MAGFINAGQQRYAVRLSLGLLNLYLFAVSIQPAPARDFWPPESRHHHFPISNPNPNLQNAMGKNVKKYHSMGVKPATYAVQSEHATAEP